MTLLPQRVIVLGPHPDDEVLGAGGLISKVCRSGGEVLVVTGCIPSEQRTDELHNGLWHLGGSRVESVALYSEPNFWLDTVPKAEMVYALEQIIASYRPDWFVLPEPRGFHQEHRAVAEAAISALRPEGATERFRPPVVVVYEEPSDYWTIGSDAHKPSLFVSIDDEDLDKKCQAMELHVTQARPIPSERSVEAIRGLATLRGAQAGVKYAEAYEVRRCLL